MKKAVVTIVIGDKYRSIYNHVAPLNRRWMDRWGWDSIIIDDIPDDFRYSHSKSGKSFGLICMLYKLQIPSLFRHYDLVAFVDCDCVINPNATCLSEYAEGIPIGGFAAVQEVSFEERGLFPGWPYYHYDGIDGTGYGGPPRFLKRHINSGLLLYRPEEVWARWLELLDVDSDLNDEYRLNISEVQDDKCLFLPEHWNVLWLYERVRRGWSKGSYGNKISRKVNQLILSLTEREKANMVLRNSSMMHFALEHDKMMLIDTNNYMV